MTTFYVACYSGDGGQIAQQRAHDLIRLGMRSAFDWWRYVSASPEEYPVLARHDIDAAKHVDLFVLDYTLPTFGGMVELGVRIAAGKEAHVVCGVPHFFFSHSLVRVHRSWGAFLSFVRPAGLWPRGAQFDADGRATKRSGPDLRKPLMGATGEPPHGLYAVRPTVEAINHGLAAAAGCSSDPEHDGPCEDTTLEKRVRALERRLDSFPLPQVSFEQSVHRPAPVSSDDE